MLYTAVWAKIFLQPFANILIFTSEVRAWNFFQDEFTP